MIKAQISGRMVSNAISDVATTSVHSEKTRLKKLMTKMMIIIIIIIMVVKKSQKTSFFRRRHKKTSAMKQRTET